MNRTAVWAASLAGDDAAHAASLRLVPGIEACLSEAALWLRGGYLGEELEQQLRRLPGARRYAVLEDGQLQAVGTLAPRGHLPEGPWQPLASWHSLDAPAIGRPGDAPSKVSLRLVRSREPAEATLLLARWQDWRAYALAAPQVRLERLAMAVDKQRRVALIGSPLPPLPGERWVVRGGVATPAGWTWSPSVDPPVVRELLGLAPQDLALMHADGSWELLAAADLVRVTRSAVRNTAEALDAAQP